MNLNPHLAIVIPTYNRAEFLDRCLELVIPSVRKYGIAIYISDNCSEDATRSVAGERAEEYPLIQYSCNSENLGPDKNFQVALGMPQADYIWLLGDTYQIQPESIDFLIELFCTERSSFDVVVFNVVDRVKGIRGGDYSDKNKLLNDLGWHMTCMSSLVYSRSLISNANFERYRDTNFIQTGIIFEYIENKNFLIRWVDDHSVLPVVLDRVSKISWQEEIFEVWIKRWSSLIFSLPPSYDIDVKLQCIKSHALKTGLFSLKGFFFLRLAGGLDFTDFRRLSSLSPWVLSAPLLVAMLIISLTPKIILKATRYIYKKVHLLSA